MATIRKKQPYDDYGRQMVDENLKELESRLSSMYDKAGKEITADLKTFMMKFEGEDLRKQAQVERGEITQQAYEDWKEKQLFRSNVMQAKIDDLSQRMVNVDKEAMAMVNKELPDIYSTSYNFGGFRAEKSAQAAGYDYNQFTIYNKDAVRVLATEDPDLIPWKPMPDEDKDMQWNRKHIQGAVQQGILQGDSMDKIADRLMPVVNMDSNAAIRTARTAVTSVENKGRKDATERVKEAGIPMVETWSCTHDSRTRDTHIMLDGTEPNEQGLYGEGILNTPIAYPADPSGDPEEVYNCRCGLISSIKGIDHSKDDELYEQFMEENYYEDWQTVKEQRGEKEEAFQAKREGAAERVEARRQIAEMEALNVHPSEATDNKQASNKIQESSFNPAANIQDAEKYAKDNYVEGGFYTFTKNDVSFKNIDLDVANAINQRLTTIYDNFNIRPLTSLESYGKKDKKVYSGHGDAPMTTSNFGNIGLNNTLIKSKDDIEKYREEGQNAFEYVVGNIDSLTGKQRELAETYRQAGRQLVDDSVEGMITHEVGHHISFGDANKDLSDIGKNTDWQEYARGLSGYANASFGEYVAESFTAYFNGEYDRLQPEMKDIFDSMRKRK